MQLLDLKQTNITQSRFYQEVKQEGRQEGETALVLRLLTRRLGLLLGEQVERVRGLSVANLEDLGEALLDFTDMADLERYLG